MITIMEIYTKKYHDKNDATVISFEGDGEDIERIKNYVENMFDIPIICEDCSDEPEYDIVNRPAHYCSHGIETSDKIETVINGLVGKDAAYLFNVLKYFDRAGLKDDAETDLDKANNYAYKLLTGKWRHEQ